MGLKLHIGKTLGSGLDSERVDIVAFPLLVDVNVAYISVEELSFA